LRQPSGDVRIRGANAAIGYDSVAPRPTAGQQPIAYTPSAKLKQLPAENIVQGL
jgi:hypothetical protein